mgnify:CR=1 FL=1
MRIVGEIDHPVLKITVFQMNNRLSVKLESGLYEQTYKFRQGEGVDTLDDVRRIVDTEFTQAVLQELQQMHQRKTATLRRHLSPGEEAEFEEII